MALGESDADRRGFLDEEALYDGSATIPGNFANGNAEAPAGLVGVLGREPSFRCIEDDVDEDPAGKTLVVNGTSYTIIRGEPDGFGLTRLVLEAA
jgi:hypothetical protein